MSIFPEEFADAIFFSRSDDQELMGTFSHYAFELEGVEWLSVEHYFQAMKFEDEQAREVVRLAATPKAARKLGRSRRKKLRADWKEVKEVIMTRAVYTRCRTYPPLTEALLATEQKPLIENSQYDYFWGCGRDRRGNNAYGKVLMKVRAKLKNEQEEPS